ncbi:MAG: GGDEF domain-containing protein [Vitreoscilla sp.]|nr:GGDEF domain-containing protein [Vitreoscilla sp.]
MAASLRDGDLVARWAGDEFLIVLGGVAEESHARGVADKLQSSLFAEPIAGAEEARVGVSIGVALYPRDGVDVEALVRHADADMYRRKRA